MNTVTRFASLFGEYWKHKAVLYFSNKRLAQAIDLADEMHEHNNGKRYFVLEIDYKPGYYQVMSWDEIKAWQKVGKFSSRAKQMDFFREAKYYTPAGVKFGYERMPKKMPEYQNVIIFSIIITLLIIATLSKLNII
jgi:hypothetical protein